MIHKTENICFPRSGQSITVAVLRDYFGDDFRYCERYLEPEKRMDVCPDTNYEKNHDFDLDAPVIDGRLYVVHIRNPLAAVSSWFDLCVENNEVKDTLEDWRRFAAMKSQFWAEFYRKWIVSPIKDRLIVDYDLLVNDPVTTFAGLARFITQEHEYDTNKMWRAIQVNRVQPEVSYRYYRYLPTA